MNAQSDQEVNLYFTFPPFPHHLTAGLQDIMVGIEERKTRVAGHFPAAMLFMVLNP